MRKIIDFLAFLGALLICATAAGDPVGIQQITSPDGSIVTTPASGGGSRVGIGTVANFSPLTTAAQTKLVGTNALAMPTSASFWPPPFTGPTNQVGIAGVYPTFLVGCNSPFPMWLSANLVSLGIQARQVQGYAFDDSHNVHIITINSPTGCLSTSGYVISNNASWSNQSALTVVSNLCLDSAPNYKPAGFFLNRNTDTIVQIECDASYTQNLLFTPNQVLTFFGELTLASNSPSITLQRPGGFTNVLNAVTMDPEGNYWFIAQTVGYDRGWTPATCIAEFSPGGQFIQTINLSLPIYNAQCIMFDPYDPNKNQLTLYVVGVDGSYFISNGNEFGIFKIVINGAVGIVTEVQTYAPTGSGFLPTGREFVKNPTNNFVLAYPFNDNGLSDMRVAYYDVSGVTPALAVTPSGVVVARALSWSAQLPVGVMASSGLCAHAGAASSGGEFSEQISVPQYGTVSYVCPSTGNGLAIYSDDAGYPVLCGINAEGFQTLKIFGADLVNGFGVPAFQIMGVSAAQNQIPGCNDASGDIGWTYPPLNVTGAAPTGVTLGITAPDAWFPVTNNATVYMVPSWHNH